MMLPTLISVSVAPVSYFFWASALPLDDARTATAVQTIENLRIVAGIMVSPILWCGTPSAEKRRSTETGTNIPCRQLDRTEYDSCITWSDCYITKWSDCY